MLSCLHFCESIDSNLMSISASTSPTMRLRLVPGIFAYVTSLEPLMLSANYSSYARRNRQSLKFQAISESWSHTEMIQFRYHMMSCQYNFSTFYFLNISAY